MEFLNRLNDIVVSTNDIVWGLPLIIFIMAVGIWLTLRTKVLQVRHLPRALRYMVKNEEGGTGEVSSFGALCTALSATIGTGNIVGVATAVCAGGPGALFWMIVAAFFGMATKYAEGLLAVKYRTVDQDGHVLGGPFYYIERGMGAKWKWLAKLFAFFGVLVGLLGIGTFTQMNGITSAVQGFFDPMKSYTINLLGQEYSWSVVISGIVITICVALVVIGGIKRIAKVTEIVVPFMAVAYVLFGIILVIVNYKEIPGALAVIIKGAFNPAAVTGGIVGSMIVAMQKGVARGIFSNESGLGSAPIASAAAKTKEPVRQGLVSMTGTFIDTIIICTMTGLAIVITGAWQVEGIEGVEVTMYAFNNGLPFSNAVSSFVLMMCLVFFAFTTILGWNYYSERCLEYLSNRNYGAIMIYRALFLVAIFIAPYMKLSLVWNIADVVNGLMAFPNLIALAALSGVVASETRRYLNKDLYIKERNERKKVA